jgi:hypothetical protein
MSRTPVEKATVDKEGQIESRKEVVRRPRQMNSMLHHFVVREYNLYRLPKALLGAGVFPFDRAHHP